MLKIDESFFKSDFTKDTMMGPNSLRIIHELFSEVQLERQLRILDLGCGRGLTSIFLATKYNAIVFATDLWISATDNYERFKSLGLENNIIPIRAEAHTLPFSENYFDIIVSIDAFHYFGTEDEYLSKHLLPLLKNKGKIYIGIPGLKHEFKNGIPQELIPFWQDDMNFHSCDWWKKHWLKDSSVKIEKCYELKCFKKAWQDWLECDNEFALKDRNMMKVEAGKYFNLIGIEAQKNSITSSIQ